MKEESEPSIISAYGLRNATITRDGKVSDSEIRHDVRYLTEEYGPMVLTPGETLDIINTKEKGELIYAKIVTDNPYANVFLELDDFRNDNAGETVAQLLYENRTSQVEGQFYANDNGSSQGFAMIYQPSVAATDYNYRIRLQVRNDLRKSKANYGFDLNSQSKGNTPTPISPTHIGGGSFTHPALAGASLDTLSKAMANPVGGTDYTVDSVINEAVFNNDNIKLGKGNLYAGIAGKPLFRRDSSSLLTSTSLRGIQKIGGVQVLTSELAPAGNTTTVSIALPAATNFPGSQETPSTSLVTLSSDGLGANSGFVVGEKLFIRIGDTVHFPGEITAITNATDSIKLTVKPGLKSAITTESHLPGLETTCWGSVASQAQVSPDILVKKVIVKRKRLVSYEG